MKAVRPLLTHGNRKVVNRYRLCHPTPFHVITQGVAGRLSGSD